MSEERASTTRPPSASADIVDDVVMGTPDGNEVDGGARHGVVDSAAGVRSAKDGGPTEMVTVRLASEYVAALGRVRQQLGGSRSDAIRGAIEVVDEALRSPSLGAIEQRLLKAVAARRPTTVSVDEDVLGELVDAVTELAAAYRSLSFQNQKIGNNHNQMVKLGNSGRVVDSDAVAAVGRELAGLTTALESQGALVSRVEEALACLRSSR